MSHLALTVLLVLAFFLPLLLLAGLCRWIFRINETVDLLKKIAANTQKEKPAPTGPKAPKKNSKPVKCEACGRTFPEKKLSRVGLGNLVCPACRKIIKS